MQFQQPDTLVPDPYNPLDWNRYAYARFNPVKYTDPTGHAVSCADGDEGGGCGSSSPKALLALKTIDTQKAVRDYVRARPHYHPEFDPAIRDDRTAYSEVAIAMMQVSQEGNSSTLAFGVTGMGGAGAIGRVDVYGASDFFGNSNNFLSYGGGASFPPLPFGSLGVSLTVTNAPSIDKLTGLGDSVGTQVIPLGPVGISAELDNFQDADTGRVYTGVSVSASVAGAAYPLAGYLYSTMTNTVYYNDFINWVLGK